MRRTNSSQGKMKRINKVAVQNQGGGDVFFFWAAVDKTMFLKY